MPQVTFITAFHNALGTSLKMLRSFRETVGLGDFEYIWVDDDSTDGSARHIQNCGLPGIRCIQNRRSRGFSGANNTGAAEATGEILVFLNNDLLFPSPWLMPMLRALELPSVGAVGNVQFNPSTRLVDHAGMFFDLDGLPRQARKDTLNIPTGEYSTWNCVTAACLAIRKQRFEQAGGFDEGYLNGYEDADLCLRLLQAGRRLLVANRSRVFHIGGASPGRHAHDAANRSLFLSRWGTLAKCLARQEWAREYLQRYSRKWWRLQPAKATLAALTMHLSRRCQFE
jgi:GT2 family glycosyltransferase